MAHVYGIYRTLRSHAPPWPENARKPRTQTRKASPIHPEKANEASATQCHASRGIYCTFILYVRRRLHQDASRQGKRYTQAFRVHQEKRAVNPSRREKMHIRSKSITSRMSRPNASRIRALACPQPAQSPWHVQSSRSALPGAPGPDSG